MDGEKERRKRIVRENEGERGRAEVKWRRGDKGKTWGSKC